MSKKKKYVPWQLCPKCNGEGFLFNSSTVSSLTRTCDVCNGAKIIPMYILSENIELKEGDTKPIKVSEEIMQARKKFVKSFAAEYKKDYDKS